MMYFWSDADQRWFYVKSGKVRGPYASWTLLMVAYCREERGVSYSERRYQRRFHNREMG